MKLILIRHAKSDWDDPLLSDHQRPLNTRGRRNAPMIGDWLQNKGHIPATALVSSATRAQETGDLILDKLSPAPERTNIDALYHSSASKILATLQEQGAGDTLIVCHNPGIADFAEEIVAKPPQHRDFMRYPTAATLVLEFPVPSWAQVRPGSGRVLDFVVPRDLDT